MSGILRASAPLARRLNAVPKGPIAQQTRGMACESPERPAVSRPAPRASGVGFVNSPASLRRWPSPPSSSRSRPQRPSQGGLPLVGPVEPRELEGGARE